MGGYDRSNNEITNEHTQCGIFYKDKIKESKRIFIIRTDITNPGYSVSIWNYIHEAQGRILDSKIDLSKHHGSFCFRLNKWDV